MTPRLRFVLPLALLALAGGAALRAEEATKTLSVDDVIAKYLTARGGREKLAALKSARQTGKMAMGPGVEAPFTWEWKRPDKVRLEFTFQGMTGIQAFDGSTAWSVMPFMGKTTPEKMADQDAKEAREMADFEGPLVDYKQKGHTVEYLGIEDADGTKAYKLKVTRASGGVDTIYIDTESNLTFKMVSKRERNGQEAEFETDLGDYKEVGGITLPFSMEMKPLGAPQGQTITIEKVEFDGDLQDDHFAMPAAPPAPAPAPPQAP
ncbi:MAG: hypothetical protein U0002_11425 [Thermoanaerobaculia bacterium]